MRSHKIVSALLGCLLAATAFGKPAGGGIAYNRDVRPILSENCFSCHGTDSASRKAGLRLDHFETATNKLEDGAVAIVPGQSERSEMIRRIFATDDVTTLFIRNFYKYISLLFCCGQ